MVNKDQKGIAPIVLILLLLLIAVIGFGSYYVYSQQKDDESTTQASTSTTNTSSDEATQADKSDEDTASTEASEDLTEIAMTRFGVMYPTSWSANIGPGVCEDVILLGSTPETTGRCQSGFGGQMMFSETTVDGMDMFSDASYSDITTSTVEINGVSCTRQTGTYVYPDGEFGIEPFPDGSTAIQYLCQKDPRVFVARYHHEPDYPDLEDTFDDLATTKWTF